MDMIRYGIIRDKRRREVVLLRGRGCAWRRCAFCDYHLDRCADADANFALNSAVLSHVTGTYGELEVSNSGSVFELDPRTLGLVRSICGKRGIRTLHFESHWMFRDRIAELRETFPGVSLKLKLGLETFDAELREHVLHKGIAETDPRLIAQGFDEANLLVGITGQTLESMRRDIELGLECFERLCVNVMCANSTPVRPDRTVIDAFMQGLYPQLAADPRVDVLLENTDFGIGTPIGDDDAGVRDDAAGIPAGQPLGERATRCAQGGDAR